MTSNPEQCASCKWYVGAIGEYGDIRCLAFSKGIPHEILTGQQGHLERYKDDLGIVWEEDPDYVRDARLRERRLAEISGYLDELKKLERNPACPRCGINVHEVIYGMPAGPPTFGYFAAGCDIDEDSLRYRWWCRKCNILIDDDSIAVSDLARKYHAFERVDKREFQRSARILQSIWRAEQGYDIGEFKSKNGSRPLGSRLVMPWARDSLSNYLNENIRGVVREEVMNPDKSKGKLYGKPRIFNDLLSSQPLCFNLFGELKRDLSLATKVMKTLTNGMVDSVTDIEFEWSPGKTNPDLTGDRSAFDVYVTFSSPNGSKGFIGIEVKYHENLAGKAASHKERYDQIASQMNCFKETSLESLKRQPLQQIWRDHLLAGIHRIANGFKEGFFVFLHPEGNTHCSDAIARYRECLTDTDTFASWTLESVVSAIKRFTDDDWIDLFEDRYLNFEKISTYVK